MKKCLVIGAVMLDVIMNIEKIPTSGSDIYAKDQEFNIGGCALNVSNILDILNIPNTLFAPIGTGAYANIICQKLQNINKNSVILVENTDNGYCLCLVEKSGERTFITLPGIEYFYKKEWFDTIDISEYDTIYVSGYEIEGNGGECIIDFLEKNKSLNIYYAPGPRINFISKDKHDRIFNLNPYVHLNLEEALTFSKADSIEKSADFIHNFTKNCVFITIGKDGVYYKNNENSNFIKGLEAKVVDTIGAGDSHIGAIIANLKLGNDIEYSLTKANKISSIVVSNKGSLISYEDII